MEAVLLVIHLIVAVSIIITILIQPSEAGGFMGNSGSMSNMMSPRRSADVLTRATTLLAGMFFLTSLMLAIAANNHPQRKSILDIPTDGKPPIEKKADNGIPAAPIANDDATKPAANDTAVAPSTTDDKPAAPAEEPKKASKKSGSLRAPISK